ncbi:MAG: hypothetical protein CL779_02615 [Chloroflexi bacterium]|nr:hypothetical protein [Chloroflexota bacterium]
MSKRESKPERKFKFESAEECMIIVRALNDFTKREEVYELAGLTANQYHQLVDDFKSFAMNYPEED